MKTLFIFGTRPEAIKMAPLIRCFGADPALEVSVCVTGQHREMLDQVLEFFDIRPDIDLALMTPNQSVAQFTARCITGSMEAIEKIKPDVVLVQGDTNSTFAGALAAHYGQVAIAHIEAGLRSGNKFSPFPEEANRTLVGHIADYHFAPTPRAVENLRREGITEHVWSVGNTGIDALLLGLEQVRARYKDGFASEFAPVDFGKRIVLVTGHRRESFGGPFLELCNALRDVARDFPDVEFVYPVHLNPNVQKPVREILGGVRNFHLFEPLPYARMIWMMSKSTVIVTDSGGVQEEAPSLAKPILVTRDVTERQEGVDAGTARLVGTDRGKIVASLVELLTDTAAYEKMARAENPYGRGDSSETIRKLLTASR